MAATSCPAFTMTVKGKVPDIIAEVKKEAKKDKVEFNGDETKGSFKAHGGDVTGTYAVTGQKITCNTKIDSIFISCKMVQDALQDYFKGK